MKFFTFSLVYLLFIACSTNNSNKKPLNFDTTNYVLKDVQLDSEKNKVFEYYVNKFDSNRVFVKAYWNQEKLQATLFYFRKTKIGPYTLHDSLGNLEVEGFLLNNKKNGLELQYRNGRIINFAVYSDGVELPVDSIVKKAFP
jgi:hypothetical protein